MRAHIFSSLKKTYFFFILLLYLSTGSLLFTGEETIESAGFKYFKNYSTKDYKLHSQNWFILEDKRGLIYAANQGGLLEYDGVSWEIIRINNQTARSIAVDDSGTIYVGGVNEMGLLAPGSKGTLHYVSLLDHLEDDQKNFSDVWKTHSTREGIYFYTARYLFRWDSNQRQMKVWEPEPDHRFNASFTCNGTFFIHQRDVGLMNIVNDSLTLVPGDETFASVKIFMMAPYDNKRILIGTRSEGFYLYDGINTVSFPTEADDFLEEKKLCGGIRLFFSPGQSSTRTPGDFALATREGGAAIIDSRGRLKQIYDKSSGLIDDNVKYVFEDSRGNLWLGMNNGISKIEYASPLSLYDDRSGLPGTVFSVTRHGPHNRLYTGTSSGLYTLTPRGQFRLVTGVTGNCWSMLSTGDSLLAATTYGVFQVDVIKNIKKSIIDLYSFVLYRSEADAKRTWVGTWEGLISLYFKNGQWTKEFQFENINQDIRTIVEDKKGNLWLGTRTKGVVKVDVPADRPIKYASVTVYNTSHGLPSGEIDVFKAAGHVMFATGKGIFRFNEENKSFLPDFTLGKEFAGSEKGVGVFRISGDKKENIWFHSEMQNILAIRQLNGTFVLYKKPFLRIPKVQVNNIYPDPDGDVTWFASDAGLVRYDTKVKKNYQRDFPCLVRKVWINGNLVFNGFKYTYTVEKNPGSIFPVIEYKDRNLRFEFAAPFFEDESATLYQCLLDGYDEDWSAWTPETRKDYTNIDSGSYTFRVRAKNVSDVLSREDVFRFKVLPPWYETWWAFSIYAFGALLLMFLIVKWRSKYLEKEKKRLETIIKERTHEIEEKNLQLENQTIQLRDQSEKLKEMDKMKSRFFANISHEFRTPLTLIMGPLEQILSNNPGKEMEGKANLMLRNSRRLLNLINQLLELAKFESGKMKLEVSLQDIVPFVKNIVLCFESLALQKKVALTFQGKEEQLPVYLDPEKLEIIITNLLSNAFKYLPAGGKVTVLVRRAVGTDSFPFGSVEISVRDTGPGIPGDQLPYIFDRFYRGTGSQGSDRKGTGIGLALSKDLVALHHGEIHVQSSCRDDHTRGTEFIIRLPLGKEHLQPGEIADPGDAGSVPQESTPPALTHTYTYPVDHDAPPQPGTDKNNKKQIPIILVVEDNPIERLFIKVTLENQFNVIEAADGLEGILRAKEIIPDLIVSDIIMPVIDGYELCRRLKKDVLTSHIPIILLTARGSEESVLQGLETGADDYITKPFSKSLLVARAGNLLELRRQLQLERKNRMTFQPENITVSPMDDEFYKKLQDTVETHLSDPDFNVEALSRVLQMSQATLYRKIHALTGKTPTSFIRSYRVKRAAQLLEAHAGNVSEVADRVGFVDKSYFAMCFKEQFHCSPSEIQSSGVPGAIDKDAASQPEPTEPNKKLLRGVQGGGFLEKSPPGRRRQEMILLVEDSEDARYYIRDSLEPGYRVVEAADGSEGIARAVEIVPDLIISDIMMPEVDGYELCRVLKSDVRTSHIPIVLLTAKVSEDSVIQGLETGADDYITKPFNTKILQVRVKNLIRLRGHLQKNRDREMALLPGKISESEIDREFMKELDGVMGKHFSDPEFNVDRLAKKLYMSRLTLYRKMLAITGETPTEFIRSYRLRRGVQLLESNFGSVLEVAFEVGFSSSSYFAKCFKEVFHQSPSDYQVSKAK
jgi:DNA-binding response OmpR family regulator/signal transduction histidine kinase